MDKEQDYEDLVELHKDDPGFEGTLVITDKVDYPQQWPPTYGGMAHVRATFKDLDHYNNVWVPDMQSGWVPAFLDQPSLESPPKPEDELLRLELRLKDGEDEVFAIEMAISAPTGELGIVSANNKFPQVASSGGCDAGPFWQFFQVCCRTQELFVGLFNALFGPSTCDGGCVTQCDGCSVNRPCHSCDPCGLSWVLCHIFGGHCD